MKINSLEYILLMLGSFLLGFSLVGIFSFLNGVTLAIAILCFFNVLLIKNEKQLKRTAKTY